MNYLKKNYGLFVILFISLLPLLNLLNPGLPVTHDGLDHVARISSFYYSLNDGNIIPRWAEYLNWGYGHPVMMFLYPLPSYIASVFYFLGFSFVTSLKITFALTYVLSGVLFYLWLKKFLNINAAILGTTLYLFAPYRFVDLYVRGAIGEHVAFMFLPLLLLSILFLFEKDNKKIKHLFLAFIFISFSTAGLILSHNGLSLLFMPFILFYILYLYYEKKSKLNLLISFISVAYGFLLSFYFWFPAFFEGKYTLRDIVTKDVYLDRFIEFKDLIYSSWGYGATGNFTVQLGIIQIIIIGISFFVLYKLFKSKNKIRVLLLFSLIYLFSSILLMLGVSKFIWEIFSLIQKLQFPWRMLAVTTFSISVIGAITVNFLNFKFAKILIYIFVLLAVIFTINFWSAKEYRKVDENIFNTPYASTTDTGESSPIWSIRSMDQFPSAEIEIIEGSANIKKVERTSTNHIYKIEVLENVKIKENTLYFPGWKIYANQIEIVPQFQDPANRGIMTFNLEKGMYDLLVIFENTKIRKFSEYISITSFSFILILFIIFILNPKLNIKGYRW